MIDRAAPSALLALLILGGCVAVPGSRPGGAFGPLPAGRALVVARVDAEANRPIVEAAEDLTVRALRGVGDVVGAQSVLAAAGAEGLGPVAAGALAQLRQGAWPLGPEVVDALDRLDVWTVIVVEVPVWEQVWGRYSKFTRVGVELHAFHLPARQPLWRTRGQVEVESKRGRAFQFALEEAVREAVAGLRPEPALSLGGLWRAWRR